MCICGSLISKATQHWLKCGSDDTILVQFGEPQSSAVQGSTTHSDYIAKVTSICAQLALSTLVATQQPQSSMQQSKQSPRASSNLVARLSSLCYLRCCVKTGPGCTKRQQLVDAAYLDHSRCCFVIVGPQLCQYGVEPLQEHAVVSVKQPYQQQLSAALL